MGYEEIKDSSTLVSFNLNIKLWIRGDINADKSPETPVPRTNVMHVICHLYVCSNSFLCHRNGVQGATYVLLLHAPAPSLSKSMLLYHGAPLVATGGDIQNRVQSNALLLSALQER